LKSKSSQQIANPSSLTIHLLSTAGRLAETVLRQAFEDG